MDSAVKMVERRVGGGTVWHGHEYFAWCTYLCNTLRWQVYGLLFLSLFPLHGRVPDKYAPVLRIYVR